MRVFPSHSLCHTSHVGSRCPHNGTEEEALAEKIMNGSKDGLVVTDLDGYIHDMNQALVDLLGWSKEELVCFPAGGEILELRVRSYEQDRTASLVTTLFSCPQNMCVCPHTVHTRVCLFAPSHPLTYMINMKL